MLPTQGYGASHALVSQGYGAFNIYSILDVVGFILYIDRIKELSLER